MKKYKQLNREQRYQIGALLEAGKNKSGMADVIGVHKCTIGRELKRNIGSRGQYAGRYIPRLAANKTEKRHKTKHKAIKLTKALKDQASGWLRTEQLSPELIAVKEGLFGYRGCIVRMYMPGDMGL